MAAVVERVDRLETALADFTTSVGIEFNKLYNSQLLTQKGLRELQEEMRAFKDDMGDFKQEMSAFKDEMSDFKDEMSDFKEEMSAFKDEMSDFKDEMREFKDEMRVFKDEVRADQEAARREQKEMNLKWGNIANKLGTMVEDLVYPSFARIVREGFDQEARDIIVRFKRRLSDGRVEEIDALAVTDELIVVNSTKATLRSKDVDDFIEQIGRFREFFPEYAALPVVGLLASLSVDDSVLRYAERNGFLVAAVGEQLMELKNHPGFEPRRWT
jgi:septal ring factor EnvC (AmiA/AmiB activator)